MGLKEAGLFPLLPGRVDRLPHRGTATPVPRLLLGVHRRRCLCPSTGRPSDDLGLLNEDQTQILIKHLVWHPQVAHYRLKVVWLSDNRDSCPYC